MSQREKFVRECTCTEKSAIPEVRHILSMLLLCLHISMSDQLLFIVHTKAIRNGAFLKFKKHFQSLYHMPNDLFVKIESSTTNFEIRKAKFIFFSFGFDHVD